MNKINNILSLIFIVLITRIGIAETTTLYTENNPIVMVTPDHPEFTLKLKSNPTTGFRWYLQNYNIDLIEPIAQENEVSKDKKIMGAPIHELWTFRVKPAAFVVPTRTKIQLIYLRPWEKSDDVKRMNVVVTTSYS
jgi:inhibitor of cysteine peptidase